MEHEQLREAFSRREAQTPTLKVDLDELMRHGRRAKKRRTLEFVGSFAAVAIIVTVAGVGIGTGPKAGGSVSITPVTPSPAASSDVTPNLYQNCRLRLLDAALAEPFWLGDDHFDPPGNRRATHTAAEVLRAYKSNPISRTLPMDHARVAFAVFSQTNPTARPVWIVVTDNIHSARPSSTAFEDSVSIFAEGDHLQYLGTLVDTLAGQCQEKTGS